MKLLNIICESMLMSDLELQEISGFKLIPFDTSGANFSAQSLWRMNCDLPQPPIPQKLWEGESVFKDIPNPLMLKHRTRLISNFWPHRFDPTLFDPDCSDRINKQVGIDPDNHQWTTFLSYLCGPMPHDWVIYWPTVGHCSYRLGPDNNGIPENIRRTTTYWLDMIRNQILPRVPKGTTILIHTDHGSARKNQTTNEYYNQGFAFIPNNMEIENLNWASFRELVDKILCQQ